MMDKLNILEQSAHLSYKGKEKLDFQMLLIQNHYTNLNSFHIWFPLKLWQITNSKADIHGDMLTVNNYFAHWIIEINITKYGNHKQLMPISFP